MKILALTDHRGHSIHNSLYTIAKAMIKLENCERLDVVSRGNAANHDFFYNNKKMPLQGFAITAAFDFDKTGQKFINDTKTVNIEEYDAVFLRLPRPIPDGFFEFLIEKFPKQVFVNRPSGIQKTSSKAFLLNIAKVCPPIRLVQTAAELDDFKKEHDLVLKPLENYGGKGLVKIEGNEVWEENETKTYDLFLKAFEVNDTPYLAMKYLKNVSQGDKRVIVVNGKILGAALRLPAKDNWLCNVSQGGHGTDAVADAEEEAIAAYLSPILKAEGVVMYGFDTLVNDDGKRVLSEINTLSIGGLEDAGGYKGEDVPYLAAEQILVYIEEELSMKK